MLAALRLLLSPRRLILIAALVAVLAVVLVLLWYFALRGDPPPPASLEAAVQSVRSEQEAPQQQTAAQQAEQLEPQQVAQAEDDGVREISSEDADYGDSAADEPSEAASPGSDATSDSEGGDGQPAEDAEEEPSEDVPPPSLAELAGEWVLSERGDSFVGYRIDEELANIGAATAVGRTGQIEASLSFDGAAVTAVEIVADLRTLRSDQSFRDGALRDRGLESDTYPFATFRLTEPIVIERLPVDGDTLSAMVAGTLELHGVTNAVQIVLEGQYVDGLVVVSGSTEIVLTDYEIEAPTGFRVLSIEESGQMEFQVVFEPVP